MSYSALLVGLGQIGMNDDLGLDPDKYVYTHARALTEHSAFDLVAAVDLDQQRCSTFEQHYHLPTYQHITEACRQHKTDLVIIATPTTHHYQALQQVLAASIPKVVLCEKPLAYSMDEADSIVRLCSENNIDLYVNYMRRSDNAVAEIKRRIENNDITLPVKGTAWYTKGLLHNGSHLLNLLEYWLGPVVETTLINHGRKLDNNDFEPDVSIKFKQGEIIFLSAWEESFSHYTIEILSRSGRLRYEHGGENVKWQSISKDPCFEGYTMLCEKQENIASDMKRYQWHVTEQLAQAMAGHRAYLCSGDEALQTLSTLINIDQRT